MEEKIFPQADTPSPRVHAAKTQAILKFNFVLLFSANYEMILLSNSKHVCVQHNRVLAFSCCEPHSEASMSMNLRDLPVGRKAKIITVNAKGEMNRRIRDMGLIPGSSVSVVGKAPLRDPIAVRLSGVTISLRNSEADYIRVEAL